MFNSLTLSEPPVLPHSFNSFRTTNGDSFDNTRTTHYVTEKQLTHVRSCMPGKKLCTESPLRDWGQSCYIPSGRHRNLHLPIARDVGVHVGAGQSGKWGESVSAVCYPDRR